MLPIPFVQLAGISLLAWTPSWTSQTQAPVQPGDKLVAYLDWETGSLGNAPFGRVPLSPKVPEGVQVPSSMDEPHFARIKMAQSRGLSIALDSQPRAVRLWVDQDF